MSQYDYGTIDPNAKSGTQLAVDLNNWRDALHSGHRGAERPLYAQAGMMWIRETSAEQWDLMLYDGDTDFVLRSVNPTTNQLIAIPQSAVSGLSEIATATAELEGKADDLEVRAGELETLAGELETKAGELEGDYANLAGRTSVLESIGKPFTKEYASGELMWSANGLLTLSHGFDSAPKLVRIQAIATTTVANTPAGSVFDVPLTVSGSTYFGAQVVHQDTESIVLRASATLIRLNNSTSADVITPAQSRLIVRAWA